MSKHKHQESPVINTVANTAEAEVVVTVEAEDVVVASPDKELATRPPSDNDGTLGYMAKVLPKEMEKSLRQTKLVTIEEFDNALAALPDEYASGFGSLLAKLNPNNDYMDSSSSGISRLDQLKIDQGAGDATLRPQTSSKGAIYSHPEGCVLTGANDAMAKMMHLPMRLKFYPLALYIGRTFFAPKVDGVVQAPEGVTVKGNSPVCTSHDRKMGNYYGECRVCPQRPFASGSYDPNSCKDVAELFIALADFTGVYRLQISTSGFKSCSQVIEQKTKGIKPWEKSFYLSVGTVKKSPTESYCNWIATPDTDGDPNGMPTPKAIRPMLELFARQIRTEVHLPQLASIYAKASELPAKANTTEKADVGAILGAVADYSTSGNV